MSRLKKYAVRLTAQERTEFERFVASGRKSAREINRARILLMADRDEPDRVLSETLGVTRRTGIGCASALPTGVRLSRCCRC